MAVAPRISLARAVSWTPGSWTTIRVFPLALDHRLRHPELVHPVAQCRHILLERELLDRLGRLLGEGETQPEVVPEVLLGHPEIRELAADPLRRLLPRLDRAKPYQDPAFGLTADGMVSNAGLAQERAHVAGVPLLGLGDRGRHVDLHEEVHPAPEVEAEVHRQQTRRGKPPRHGGSEVQGDDVAGAEAGPQEILGLELDFGVAESGRAGGPPRAPPSGREPPAASRAPATRAASAASRDTPRSPEICTAGSSPNTFGRAKTTPATSTAAMRRCFQNG